MNNHLSTREDLKLRNNVDGVGSIEPCISSLVDRAVEGRDVEFKWIGVPQMPGSAFRLALWVDVDVEVELAPGSTIRGYVEEDLGVSLVRRECTQG